MRSSELQEALKRARMKTEIEAKNGIEKTQNSNKKEERPDESRESNFADRAPSPAIEKQSKKQTKAKTPLNLDSGNNFFCLYNGQRRN